MRGRQVRLAGAPRRGTVTLDGRGHEVWHDGELASNRRHYAANEAWSDDDDLVRVDEGSSEDEDFLLLEALRSGRAQRIFRHRDRRDPNTGCSFRRCFCCCACFLLIGLHRMFLGRCRRA